VTLLAVDLAGDLEQIAVGVAIALVVACVAGFWRLIIRLNKQDAVMAANKDVLLDLKAQLAREFGGNSGGIREAINGLKNAQAADTKRLDEHLEAHATGRPQ